MMRGVQGREFACGVVLLLKGTSVGGSAAKYPFCLGGK